MEGAQAVREAVRYARVHELFVTAAAAERHPDLVEAAAGAGARTSLVTDTAAGSLSDTVTPQGLVAVCDLLDVPVDAALGRHPSLVAVCAGIADPGNAGTVIRVADAAGADAVLLAGDTVDPHNGKAVRASTGSVFHLPLARDRDATAVLDACAAAGLTVLAADAAGELDLHEPAARPVLAGPVAWVFGGEAHGVPGDLAARADHRVRIPIHGRAESLNLAAAAAVCLYASAAARRG
ncbi:RNA methyltransferase [Pseudonocardia adelaidensis]|uniref:RNA methyltransferase n=1 Tax=Pseudonocardia adelaidensis TaxID=648754 RepID=A0ABP9P3M1_9PSEU